MKIDPRWLTSTVVDLCANIRESKQYDLLMPILGDALMDAGCDNEELINQCHTGFVSPFLGLRDVCLLLGGEYSEAVAAIEEYGAEIECPYEYYEDEGVKSKTPEDLFVYMMTAGKNWSEGNKHTWLSYTTPDAAYNEYKVERFWENYELVMGIKVESKDSLFCCSC